MTRSISVFCGSSNGADVEYGTATRAFASELIRRGIRLVYGGAMAGLMGTLANAALEAGGTVIGVMPQALIDREIAHRSLTELRIVQTMHERKAMMAELADAFVALPGGLGTLEELFEVWTWGQLGLHHKPLGLLNVRGYFDPLVSFLDHARDEGFIRAQQRDALMVDADASVLLDKLASAIRT